MPKHKKSVSRDDSGGLYATLSPDLINNSDLLQQLTYRQLISTLYITAKGQKGRKVKGKRVRRRTIPVPSRYELINLFSRDGERQRSANDYRQLADFIMDIAPEFRLWDILDDGRLRFRKRYWRQNLLDENYVRADIDLLLRLPHRPEHVRAALFLEAWVNKPGRYTKPRALEEIAEYLGLSTRNMPRLRRRVMQIFREVKDALGSDWKGLDVKFSVVRNSRYALNFVYVNHFKSRGRIRKLTSKVSDLE